jgi:hypothetical protein
VSGVFHIQEDQGHQVRITWTRSGYDPPSSSTPITEYAVFRRIDPSLLSHGTDRAVEEELGLLGYPHGDRDFVETVPAYCEDSYSTVVPTLADSTLEEGVRYSVFFVRAGIR